MKKLLFTAMFALVFCLTAFAVSAKEYHIYTAEDMYNVRNDLSGTYYLENDIDLSVYENWEPIGNRVDGDTEFNEAFCGVFDGQGYIITGLNVDMFGNTDSVLETGNKSFRSYAGLFGFINKATIKNIKLQGSISASINGDVGGYFYAGVLVGFANESKMTNCTALGTIDVTFDCFGSVDNYVGGLVGCNLKGTIDNCYSECELLADATSKNSRGANVIGGFVGRNSGSIVNCYNVSNITAVATSEEFHAYNMAGGFMGENNKGTVANCYAKSEIEATMLKTTEKMEMIGGFLGFNLDGTIDNSYYNKDTGLTDTNATPLTTTQMKISSSFSGFDFTNIWAISPDKNNGYPYLRSVPTDGTPMLVSVFVNGTRVNFDVAPTIIDGRTLVPLRAIFESLGATVEWDDFTKTVTGTKDGTTIKMTVGQNTFTVNDEVKTLDVPSQIIDGRTLVPVRAISESFGVDVEWHAEIKTVCVKEKSFTAETVTMTDKNGAEQQVESFLCDLYSRLGFEK